MEGQRFGKLLAVKLHEIKEYRSNGKLSRKRVWECLCDCGKTTYPHEGSLKKGMKSCGCDNRKKTKERWAKYRESAKPFWEKVKKANECWLWQGALDQFGYGHTTGSYIGQKNKTLRVHRVSYELHNGKIPDGMNVLHKCDVRNCVNPEHLFLGSQDDNMQDMAKKGRRKGINCGSENGRAKLTAAKVKEIRELYKTGHFTQMCLARIYGISQAQISTYINSDIFT